MHVLHLIDGLGIGGTERSLVGNLSRLRDLGCQNIVGYLSGAGTLVPDVEKNGATVIRLGGRGGRAGQFVRLLRVLRRERPDLLHTNLFWADQLGRVAGRLLGIPVVSTFVNTSYEPERLLDNPHLSPFKLGVVRRVDGLTARIGTHFIAVSATVAESNARWLHIERDRISVVHRGREVGAFAEPAQQARGAAAAEFGLTPDARVLLNVGRLSDQKGQRFLVEAMPTVLQRVPEAVLLIAGEGRRREQLESRIAELTLGGSVRLLGNRRDVARLLAAADLFVFPSLFEGAAGAVIEAMLAGKAVLASDLPALRECLGDIHGSFFVPVGDVQGWAEGIIALLLDFAVLIQTGEMNRQLAQRMYNLDVSVKRQCEVYESVVRHV